MCRLLGIIANCPVDLEFSLTGSSKSFEDLGRSNPDGWGIGYYQDGSAKLCKEPLAASNSGEFRNLAVTSHSSIFICHVRKATNGNKSYENCHPFSFNNWMFAHNGCVDRSEIKKMLDEKHQMSISGQTDSEVYFLWIIQNLEEKSDYQEAFKSSISTVRQFNHTGLNFLLSDGNSLWAYRNASKNLDYYSLYYLVRDPSQPHDPIIKSKELDVLIHSKGLTGERAVLVCSEKLTEEAWTEIPLRHLLRITKTLEIHLQEVK